MGAFLSSVQAGRPPPSQIIDVMSIYHPFPLRIDSINKGGPVQYDACLQLGEFPSDKYKGNSAVVLFPLKASNNPGEKGRFMNKIASEIPNILNQQPDPITGYPEVPASTGYAWNLEDIIFMKNNAGETVSRAFYAWINKTPFPVGVVVMAEPVFISQADMDNIKRLPITPPSDVIHEIGTPILYKPGPVVGDDGVPQPCPETPAEIAAKAMSSIKQPFVPPSNPGIDLALFFQIVLGTLATVVVILGVWLGIKLAMGPGSTVMKSLGESLGKSLAGGYDALKKVKLPVMPPIPPIPKIPESVKESARKTRRNIGNRLGFGSDGKFGPKRQPPKDTPLGDVFPDITPSSDLKMTTNPLFNKDRTRKNSKQGSISSIANLPAVNIPEPSPAPAAAQIPTLENIVDDMPAGVTVNPVVARRRSARNTRKSSVNSIKNIPEITNTKPPENTAAAISNLPTPEVNPALQELEEIEKGIDNRKKKVSNAFGKLSATRQFNKSLSNKAVREIDEWSSTPPPVPSDRKKTLRNSTLKVIAAKQAEKKLGQVQAQREIDSWMSDEPAPASAAVPAPVPAKEPLIPKSEFETWDRSRQSAYVQKLKKDYAQRVVNGYIVRMKTTIGNKPGWNPSTKVDSVSRLGKGGRKRRNRRKTGHHLRNRKKTGRRV